ncbi:hypothetical protein [Vibrio parahaemolyticus]|uniref:hypothetical protein n=1 Tax=Vibrio parahaemolyticus TaxID=670 RepID=UPI00235DEBCE|nr:hypothetical protein [Vibrio parahaemolyticus]
MTDKSTEIKLREALERLINRTPNTIGFKRKVQANKPYQITKSGVEKEAELSNNCLRHYPEILIDIAKAEAERVHGKSQLSENISESDIMSSPIYQQLESKLKRSEEAKKKLKIDLKKLKEELDLKDKALNEKVVELDEVISSMWALIPRDEQRKLMIQKTENILDFKRS